MDTDRIKKIQKETGFPNSVSVQQVLLKVWNETKQERETIPDDKHGYTAMEWLERGVRGAIPRGKQDGLLITECARWVAVRDAFNCGSGYAIALCNKFGLDPDETIKT